MTTGEQLIDLKAQLPPPRTWETALAYIRSHYLVTQEDKLGMELLWSFPRTETGSERAYQKARVGQAEAMGMTWLVVIAPVGPRTLLDPMGALELNGLLLNCAVACCGENVVVRAALPFAGLDGATLSAILEAVPFEAARLRELGQPATSGPIFDEYGA